MRKNLMPVHILLVTALFCLNCSLVTNFDPDLLVDGDAGALYSLAANIADPVEVVLFDNGTASIVLELEEPLPDEDDETYFAMIDEGIIDLTVLNNDTLVSTDLTDGTRIDDGSSPSSAGEYVLSLNETRDELGVLFWNETENNQSLREDGNYSTVVEVSDNRIIEAEVILRDVTVSTSQ
jgi:hypothetical protein